MDNNKQKLTVATPGAVEQIKNKAPKTENKTSQTVATPGNVAKGQSPENINVTGAKELMKQNGYSGIRETLVDRGVDNSRIGFNNDTGFVTIDGTDAFKPQHNIEGTTYAAAKDIDDMTKQAYNQAGNPLMAARDYVSSKGYTGIVNWDADSGTVNIGGQNLKPVSVSEDGIAYIPQSQLDAAIAAYEKNTGIITNKGVLEGYDKKYDANIEDALNHLVNRKEFNYDPEKDVVYKAYEKQYNRQAEEAFRKMLNDNNTSVTGASGAVLSQAMAARDAEKDKLTDVIPSLYQDAYNRYMGETDRLRNNLNDVMSAENDYYNKTYQSNRDSIGDSVNAGAAERNKQLTENEARWSEMRNAIDMGYYPQEKLEGLKSMMLQNQQSAFNYGMSIANQRGSFSKSDEQYLPWISEFRNDDGTYRIDPYMAEMLYNYMTQYWNNKGAYDSGYGTYTPPQIGN